MLALAEARLALLPRFFLGVVLLVTIFLAVAFLTLLAAAFLALLAASAFLGCLLARAMLLQAEGFSAALGGMLAVLTVCNNRGVVVVVL